MLARRPLHKGPSGLPGRDDCDTVIYENVDLKRYKTIIATHGLIVKAFNNLRRKSCINRYLKLS